MKRTTAIAAAALTAIALTGCTAYEVQPGPETMPAIEPGSVPTDSPAQLTSQQSGPWELEDVEVSGATPALESYALDALESHATYYQGITSGQYSNHPYELNIGGVDKWLKITAVDSAKPGSVEFTLESDYASSGLKNLAGKVACELTRFGTNDKYALDGLKSVTLTGSQSGESGTAADPKTC